MSKEERRQQLDEALGFDFTKRRFSMKGNLSQKKLAARLSVSRRAVSGWESGEYWPSLPQLVALRRVLSPANYSPQLACRLCRSEWGGTSKSSSPSGKPSSSETSTSSQVRVN